MIQSPRESANLRLFYNIRQLIDFSTSKLFYYNFIHPYLTYGIHLYFPMSPNSQTKYFFGLQKRALRLICKPYQSHLIKKPSLAHSSLTKLRSFHSPLFPHTSPASVLTTSRISSALLISLPASLHLLVVNLLATNTKSRARSTTTGSTNS